MFAVYHRVLRAECPHLTIEILEPEMAGGLAHPRWCGDCPAWIPFRWVTATLEQITAAGDARPIRQPKEETA